MAIGSPACFEVQAGGSDTANGGGYNPAAGTLNSTGAVSSANTASPVFTSSAYSFVAGDVGHWLYIQSGTNTIPGMYQIVSVNAGAATLNAAIGAGRIYQSAQGTPIGMSTVAGVGTASSLSGVHWAIDYSQQSTGIALTGLSTAAVSATILTSAATVAMIGNIIQITGGTNFTTGFYQITAVSAGVSITVDRAATTGAGSSGTAGLGGALATPGKAGAVATTGCGIFWQYSVSPYVASSASTNVSGGCVAPASNTIWQGYQTSRFIGNTDINRPTFQVGSGISSAILFKAGSAHAIYNVIFDGNGQTGSQANTSAPSGFGCFFKNFVGTAVTNGTVAYCNFTGNSGVSSGSSTSAQYCEAFGNSATPFTGASVSDCISANNTGATTHGFQPANSSGIFSNNTSYNNGGNGFNFTTFISAANCIAESNGRFGYQITTGVVLHNCADFNNTSGRLSNLDGFVFARDINPITGTSSFFVNAAGGDFALNNTANAGKLLRGLGFPTTFPAGTTPNFADVGAAQHQDSGGVSGARIFAGF